MYSEVARNRNVAASSFQKLPWLCVSLLTSCARRVLCRVPEHLPFRHDCDCYQARTRHNLTTTWSCKGNPVLQKLGCEQAMQGRFRDLEIP
jgi:hypothetical protein